jgi:predicted DNA-binding transcriptional regulator AlpA
MTHKKVILRMPEVLESLGIGVIQILDFGFWI